MYILAIILAYHMVTQAMPLFWDVASAKCFLEKQFSSNQKPTSVKVLHRDSAQHRSYVLCDTALGRHYCLPHFLELLAR